MTDTADDLARCPACDRVRMEAGVRGLIGWLVAAGFLLLWLADSHLGRCLGALLIEWVA